MILSSTELMASSCTRRALMRLAAELGDVRGTIPHGETNPELNLEKKTKKTQKKTTFKCLQPMGRIG